MLLLFNVTREAVHVWVNMHQEKKKGFTARFGLKFMAAELIFRLIIFQPMLPSI